MFSIKSVKKGLKKSTLGIIMSVVYLDIEYSIKDKAKALGASWCPNNHKWYALSDNPNLATLQSMRVNKIYLAVEYAYKDDVKKLGAKWEPYEQAWYVYENNPNVEKLCRMVGRL
jgi:general stress protein 26